MTKESFFRCSFIWQSRKINKKLLRKIWKISKLITKLTFKKGPTSQSSVEGSLQPEKEGESGKKKRWQ